MSADTSSCSLKVGKPMAAETSGVVKKNDELLDWSEDAYGGVMVDVKESMHSEVFASLLRASMEHWGKKAVWIKLPIELVNLFEVVVKQGFRYHHAEPIYLMLVKWIPKTVDVVLANALHRVGIGAFVMNNIGEVLVVQANSSKFKGMSVWNFSTGAVDEGEDVSMAAIKEVKEEAGIDTEFVEVIAFCQSHKSFFGKSDLFFVCMLKPLSFNIQKQDLEIAEAKWIPFDEYAAQPFVQEHEMFKHIANVCLEKKKNRHIRKNCPRPQRGYPAIPIKCFNCGKDEHIRKNCPQLIEESGANR